MPKEAPILVVEDDPTVREALVEMAEVLGYPAIGAENGAAGLALLRERRPRLVLLDLKMPVMDGWAFLEALRADPQTAQIPVLILSAWGFEWEAELMGAQGYIGKPADFRAVQEKLVAFAGPPPRRR